MLRFAAFLRGASTLNTDAVGSAPPDAFGPFRVLHQIGAGVLGPVFRAYQPEQDRLVAVKLFRLDLPPERAHQLVAELEKLIASDLSHPSIATPIATGLSGVSAYLAQDFVAADSLDTLIRQGPAPVADAARVAAQLGSALGVAAALDLAHGALHPRDLLVSTDDVRVTGVGIAQILERLGIAPPIRRPYTAPERLAGEPWDRRADVFSLAALCYEFLTGRRIAGPGDLSADALNDVADIDKSALRRVLSRALAEQPSDRFETGMAFTDAFQDALGRRPKAAARISSRRLPRDTETVMMEPEVFAPVPPQGLPLLSEEILTPHETAATADDIGADLPLVPRLPDEHDLPLAAADPEAPTVDLRLSSPKPDDLHLASLKASREAETIVVPSRKFDDVADNETDVADNDDGADDDVAALAAARPLRDAHEPGPAFTEVPEARAVFAGAEESSSATSGVRPLMLALVVGVAIGFGSAMLILAPERAAPRTAAEPPATPIVDEPIREFTERAVVREEPKSPIVATPTAEPPVPRPLAEPVQPAAPVVAAPVPAAPAAVTPRAPQRTAERTTPVTRPATKPPASARAAGPAPSSARARTPVRPNATAPASPAPKTGPGSLFVESRPVGANVFLDGRLVGTTPMILESVPNGDHAIHLERSGYQRWASSVRVTPGERSRVAASLEYR